MNSSLLIKPLDNTFSQEIVNLILPIQQIEFNVPVTLKDQPDLLDIETNYDGTGGKFWGAFDDDQLVGTIALIGTGHQAGAIRKMFVKKDWRGKEHGIASRLLDTLLHYCQENGIEDLYLGTVAQLKAAQRFYEKNGFAPIQPDHLPDYFPRMKADSLFYHLHLTTSGTHSVTGLQRSN
jgi:N-acetylglutamate synthase-like GNAT family acetyltransferase